MVSMGFEKTFVISNQRLCYDGIMAVIGPLKPFELTKKSRKNLLMTSAALEYLQDFKKCHFCNLN